MNQYSQRQYHHQQQYYGQQQQQQQQPQHESGQQYSRSMIQQQQQQWTGQQIPLSSATTATPSNMTTMNSNHLHPHQQQQHQQQIRYPTPPPQQSQQQFYNNNNVNHTNNVYYRSVSNSPAYVSNQQQYQSRSVPAVNSSPQQQQQYSSTLSSSNNSNSNIPQQSYNNNSSMYHQHQQHHGSSYTNHPQQQNYYTPSAVGSRNFQPQHQDNNNNNNRIMNSNYYPNSYHMQNNNSSSGSLTPPNVVVNQSNDINHCNQPNPFSRQNHHQHQEQLQHHTQHISHQQHPYPNRNMASYEASSTPSPPSIRSNFQKQNVENFRMNVSSFQYNHHPQSPTPNNCISPRPSPIVVNNKMVNNTKQQQQPPPQQNSMTKPTVIYPHNSQQQQQPQNYPRMINSPTPAAAPVANNNNSMDTKPLINQFSNDHRKNIINHNNNNIHLRQALGMNRLFTSSPSIVAEDNNKMANENIVERTKPVLIKKSNKMINIGQVDPKKILLSLKSGLLAESTWALDCLQVLSRSGTLRVQHVPNILSYLMEYYKCFLDTIFVDLFVDNENQSKLDTIKNQKKRKLNDFHNNNNEDGDNISNELFEKSIQRGEKIFLLDSTNYTFKSRINGLPVKLKKDDLSFNQSIILNIDEDPEYFCLKKDSFNNSTISTMHIIQTMDPLKEMIPFIKTQTNTNNNNNNNNNEDDDDDDDDKKCNLKNNNESKYPWDDEAEKYDVEINQTLCPRRESLELLLKRCLCVSNILRNLSFTVENARNMAGNSSLILMLARLLSYYHKHCDRKTFENTMYKLETKSQEKENQEVLEILNDFSFETLHLIRMNSFVTLSNISDYLDLSKFSDKIIMPLLDSLLHWAVCQSSYAKDNLPPDNLSCQIQALEIMSKLSINISNIDLILATPPFDRIENFFKVLVQLTGKEEDQVLRELSLIVMSHFVQCDNLSARIIMHTDYSISNLLTFIEQKEYFNRSNNIMPSQSNNNNHLQFEHEEIPSKYMLKHAANIIRTFVSECEHNDLHLIRKYEERLVHLTMSIFSDPEVANILADIVFILSNRKSK